MLKAAQLASQNEGNVPLPPTFFCDDGLSTALASPPSRRVLPHGDPSQSVWMPQAESAKSARSLRRQSNLDQIEIPEDHALISEDILGMGGFGTVYIADYNGRNAAAKVRVPRWAKMGTQSTLVLEK